MTAADPIHVVCPHCHKTNRMPAARLGEAPRCGAARGEVCLLKVMGRDVDITVTGMVTARHADGRLTIFVPCGPNPTTGFIYHVASELVELRPDIKVETMMKTVIGCGVGAADVLRKR